MEIERRRKIARAVNIFVLLSFSYLGFGLYQFDHPDLNQPPPAGFKEDMKKNVLISGEVNKKLDMGKFSHVKEVEAYSIESSFGRSYIVKFSLDDGREFRSSYQGSLYQPAYIPKKFYLTTSDSKFYHYDVYTDGREYVQEPNQFLYNSISRIINDSFIDANIPQNVDEIWEKDSKKFLSDSDVHH